MFKKKYMIEIHVYSVAGNKQITGQNKIIIYWTTKMKYIFVSMQNIIKMKTWKNGVHVVQPAICRALLFII